MKRLKDWKRLKEQDRLIREADKEYNDEKIRQWLDEMDPKEREKLENDERWR